jgi:hypothetical protein
MNANELFDVLLTEESLKVSRDLKNVLDTAFNDGKVEERIKNIKKALIRNRLSIEEIAEDFDTTVEFVTQIKQMLHL